LRLRRDPRYISDPGKSAKQIRFFDFQGVERTCRVWDFSRTGVSFLLEDGSLIFRIGDIISDMYFISYSKEMHSGPATIIHILDEYQNGKVVSRIGCRLENVMDISSIIQGDKITKLKNDYLDFIHSLAVEDNLDEEFVHLTSHLHYLLTNLRNKLREEEAKIREEEEDAVRKALYETLLSLTFDVVNDVTLKYSNHFTKITGRFTDSKQPYIHREYFQKILNEFFMSSALFRRAYTKPLGYAGDYEMMNIIYRNAFEGEDLFSQVMNKVDCEGSAARAVRNRREYFCAKILSACESAGTECRILSVACGPCVEMEDFFGRVGGRRLPASLTLVAMDQDPNAVENARQRILPLVEKMDGVEARIDQDNIKDLILGRSKKGDNYLDADLIYSAGLCDYLSVNAVTRLVNELYRYLKPGGSLRIGNFGPYNPQRFKMEYGSEWFLIHRSEEDIKEFAAGLPEDAIIRVEKESEGVNLFLNVTKPG
jgi:SAM-dependent methyltransferase